MPKLIVTDREGARHELDGPAGWSVMEVIRENGLPVEAACGGCCACATCHVHVAPAWAERLAPMREDEEGLLGALPQAAETSRLSCQIIWDTDLDGLELTLLGEAP